ncbi:hypothetical protein GCM10007390_36320 [Persicitalea jodogahamensis]|uniref:Uncharacterized protein n=1 Tax=Persicitalea jodogahamensis TaxID=402147 RepID=A0A8J3GB27_9BACT|nr:hypothetical protein GCM10007390_36320 [Persicitalea jodogahamensis]
MVWDVRLSRGRQVVKRSSGVDLLGKGMSKVPGTNFNKIFSSLFAELKELNYLCPTKAEES